MYMIDLLAWTKLLFRLSHWKHKAMIFSIGKHNLYGAG